MSAQQERWFQGWRAGEQLCGFSFISSSLADGYGKPWVTTRGGIGLCPDPLGFTEGTGVSESGSSSWHLPYARFPEGGWRGEASCRQTGCRALAPQVAQRGRQGLWRRQGRSWALTGRQELGGPQAGRRCCACGPGGQRCRCRTPGRKGRREQLSVSWSPRDRGGGGGRSDRGGRALRQRRFRKKSKSGVF